MCGEMGGRGIMEEGFRLESRCYGVQSARYPAAAVVAGKVAVPLGGEVHIRSLTDFHLQSRFKVSDDTIMVLLPCPSHGLILMSYSGLVSLYSLDGVRKAQTHSSQRTLRHGAVSSDGLLVCACGEFGLANGTIDVWEISETQFVLVGRFVGNYRFPEFTQNNFLFAMRETVLEADPSSPYSKDQPIPPDRATVDFPEEHSSAPIDLEALRAAKRENRQNTYLACQFSLQGASKSLPIPTISYIISCKSNQTGLCAYMFLNRNLLIMDTNQVNIIANVNLAGAGAIVALTMEGNSVYFSPGSGLLTEIKVGLEELGESLEVIRPINSSVTTINTHISSLNKGNYHLSWVLPHTQLFICEESGLFLINFPNYPQIEGVNCVNETGHNTTCCGVAINPGKSLVCSGDFSGQVFIWSIESGLNEPIARFTVFVPIRSISWCPGEDYVLIGTMTGSLHRISTPLNPHSEPVEVLNLDHTIVCMGWNWPKLALGTTQGELKIYSMDSSEPRLELAILAHAPSEDAQNPHFGSLTLYSEIWTLCWSPKGRNLLATGSEDQTVVIWDLNTISKVATLPKHRNAVTGVSWKEVNAAGLRELLVSCSDDQQIRLYDPETWEMIHTFRSTFICEWHTLTYLALEEHGCRVAVVSQNGYFFLYDVSEKKCLFGEKVHSGSVEGLVWTGEVAATVSSDCSVCVYNLARSIGSPWYNSHHHL